jgi:signal transduction histidine kinase
MSSRLLSAAARTIGVRLTIWYAALFLAGTTLLLSLAYLLVATSLAAGDREAVREEAQELAAEYRAGGVEGIARFLEAHERAGFVEPFHVRVIGRDGVVHYVKPGDRWADPTLEIVTTRLSDDLELHVGKTALERAAVLARFRRGAVGILVAAAVLGVGGGGVLAVWALRPLRQIIGTVRAIRSGTLDARVPTRGTRDELDELGRLFNDMLDQIAALIHGMQSALDNVAHDLRTPLTRMRGAAEIALRSGGGDAAHREVLADCVEEADQLLTMLNMLMDVSEAEAGTLRLTRTTVRVRDLLDGVVEVYRDVAEDKRITLTLDVGTDLAVDADRSRMRQVIANLLDNAIKYTPAGGRIAVIGARQDEVATIIVADTGIGMTAAELPKIWDRLYRGDRSRSERGLGLGLSLVRAIVHAHGGRVDVTTTPGIGSTFRIALPVRALEERREDQLSIG